MSIRHLLATPRHAQLELSSSLAPPLSRRHRLCIRLIRTFPVKVFSIIFLIRSPHAFFVWFDRSSMRCHLCTTRRTSSVIISLKFSKHGKSSWLSLQKFSAGKLVRKRRSYFENEQSIFCPSCTSQICFRDCTRFDVHNQFRQLSVSFHVAHPSPARFDRCRTWLLWSVGFTVSRIPIPQTCNVVVVLKQRLASFQHLRSSSL